MAYCTYVSKLIPNALCESIIQTIKDRTEKNPEFSSEEHTGLAVVYFSQTTTGLEMPAGSDINFIKSAAPRLTISDVS